MKELTFFLIRHLISKLRATPPPYLSLTMSDSEALNCTRGLRYACLQKNEIEKSPSVSITYFSNSHSEITLQMLKCSLTSITSDLSWERNTPM